MEANHYGLRAFQYSIGQMKDVSWLAEDKYKIMLGNNSSSKSWKQSKVKSYKSSPIKLVINLWNSQKAPKAWHHKKLKRLCTHTVSINELTLGQRETE